MKELAFLFLLGITFSARAQTSLTLTLSLKQAMDTGLQNRFDIKANQYDISLAENNINKSKKAWIPNIHAEGNIQFTTQIQPTFVPKGFVGFNEAGLLVLGAKNTTVFGLSLNQPLFNPGIHTDIEIARVNLNLKKEITRDDEIKIRNEIATAYLNVLLKRLQYQISENEENRFKEYEELAKGKYRDGALIENDYLKAKLDYKNAKVKTEEMQQQYHLALTYLKYQINLPEETSLVLSDSIGNISFLKPELQTENALNNRTEIRQLKLEQNENSLLFKRTKENALPNVSLAGYYAQMYQNQNFRYDESKWWAPHSYIGLQISIPITENFLNKNNIREYNIKQQQLRLYLQQKELDVHYQVQKAMTDLKDAQQNMQSAKDNYHLSLTVYKNQQQRFAIGVFQYSDLLNTERSLQESDSNYIQSVYNYLTAEIAYQKALGKW